MICTIRVKDVILLIVKNVLFTNHYPLAHFVYTSIEFKDRSDENL